MRRRQARDLLGLSYRAASQNVEQLVAAGILRQFGDRERTVFLAEEILLLVDSDSSAQ